MRLVMECSEADGFHFLLVTYEADEGEYLAQNDLLLLSKEEVHILFFCLFFVRFLDNSLCRMLDSVRD